jgi:predicted DNA binding CopG/RHH family protein
MKSSFVKSLKEYEDSSEFDEKSILEAAKRLKARRKIPTSVALEENTVKALKAVAEDRGVPYQVLMRMFILEGLKKLKKIA